MIFLYFLICVFKLFVIFLLLSCSSFLICVESDLSRNIFIVCLLFLLMNWLIVFLKGVCGRIFKDCWVKYFCIRVLILMVLIDFRVFVMFFCSFFELLGIFFVFGQFFVWLFFLCFLFICDCCFFLVKVYDVVLIGYFVGKFVGEVLGVFYVKFGVFWSGIFYFELYQGKRCFFIFGSIIVVGGFLQGISLFNYFFNNCYQVFGDFLVVVLFFFEFFELFVFCQYNFFGDEWLDCFQGNFVYCEMFVGYVENCNFFCYCFVFYKRGGYGGIGLDDMEIGDIVFYGIY